jgi:hypothetical protein
MSEDIKNCSPGALATLDELAAATAIDAEFLNQLRAGLASLVETTEPDGRYGPRTDPNYSEDELRRRDALGYAVRLQEAGGALESTLCAAEAIDQFIRSGATSPAAPTS